MKNYISSLCLLLLFGCSVLLSHPIRVEAHDDEDPITAEEVQELKQKVEELENRIEHRDKHILHKPETKSVARFLDGLEFGVGVTGIVQGSSGAEDPVGKDHTDASGSLDLELQAAIGDQGTALLLVESREGGGLNDDIETLHGINADAVDDDGDFELTEAWYEHAFLGEDLLFTIGKVDLTNYFDNNAVANDETLQFLSDGFVNNIAVEFPEDNGPGLRLAYSPNEKFEMGLGLGQANGEFEDVDRDTFGILEAIYKPLFLNLEGNYRLYGWLNRSDHPEWDDPTDDDEHNWGIGFSLDQAFHEKFTGFLRAGMQDDSVSQVDYALSVGGEIFGLLPNRQKDVMGIALGYAHLSDDYEDSVSPVSTDPEQKLEIYYSIHLNEHLLISPDVQVIRNPAGLDDADTITILGVRAQLFF